MVFREMMDSIIKARADVIHAGRLLAQWGPPTGGNPEPNEYLLLADLIREANEALDSVVSRMVKESRRLSEKEDEIPSRLKRRSAAHRSRPS
jgi:hypothetical protein